MLKKEHKSSTEVGVSREKPLQCSGVTKKALVCESGHTVCGKCSGKSIVKRADSGDCIVDKSLSSSPLKSRKLNIEPKDTLVQINSLHSDLASGDHYKRSKKSIRNCKSETKVKFEDQRKLNINKNKKNKCVNDLETIVEFKNTKFNDTKSSCSSLSSSDSIPDMKNLVLMPKNCKVCPRPVTCPILECSKMVAMDSVMLHFYFDHSKVPRQNLTKSSPSQFLVKASSICTKTICLAVLLLQDKSENLPLKDSKSGATTTDSFADHNAVLLMAARMKIAERKPSKNASTQTDIACYHESKKKKLYLENESENKQAVVDKFENNEFVLLWLCQLENSSSTYSISVFKTDKTVGHSYISQPIHIREHQDAPTMYQQCDCLIIRGSSANKLLDDQNQFIAHVNLL